MFIVYILNSEKLEKYYVGYTADMESRLLYHNSGRVNFTSKGIPWVLKHTEFYSTEVMAVRREREIKSKKKPEIH